ncbi:MAG TPA: hypothetical protein VFM60_03340 [Salinimicrobium sp.]|nr:hypothetical protein [Salinimicrobium sp.]
MVKKKGSGELEEYKAIFKKINPGLFPRSYLIGFPKHANILLAEMYSYARYDFEDYERLMHFVNEMKELLNQVQKKEAMITPTKMEKPEGIFDNIISKNFN